MSYSQYNDEYLRLQQQLLGGQQQQQQQHPVQPTTILPTTQHQSYPQSQQQNQLNSQNGNTTQSQMSYVNTNPMYTGGGGGGSTSGYSGNSNYTVSYNPYDQSGGGFVNPHMNFMFPPQNNVQFQPSTTPLMVQPQSYRIPSTAPYVPPVSNLPPLHSYTGSQNTQMQTPLKSNVTNRDEEIARVLQQVEEASLERELKEKKEIERLDRLFAEKLMIQITTPIPTTPVTQPSHNMNSDELFAYNLQRQEMAEEEQRKREEEQRRLQALRDEEIARRLEEEERKAIQIKKDEELAKKLLKEEQERERRNQYNNYYTPQTPSPPSQVLNGKNRKHVVSIHNSHCFCGKTQTYNNNHLKEIHDRYCTCQINRSVPSNAGRKHTHDSRCCTQNHLHTINCYCVFRSHVNNVGHGNGCCPTFHNHTDYCHCISK